MTRAKALEIGRKVQVHGDGWSRTGMAQRIAEELMKAFDAGAEFERVSALSETMQFPRNPGAMSEGTGAERE